MGRLHPAQGESCENSPSYTKRPRFSENLNWLFSGDSDSIYFRGLEKGKRQKESLEGAAGDYAVFTIQSCILKRMSFLEVTEPRCAAQAWKERTTCKCTPVNGLEATSWSHALLLGYLFLKRDFWTCATARCFLRPACRCLKYSGPRLAITLPPFCPRLLANQKHTAVFS